MILISIVMAAYNRWSVEQEFALQEPYYRAHLEGQIQLLDRLRSLKEFFLQLENKHEYQYVASPKPSDAAEQAIVRYTAVKHQYEFALRNRCVIEPIHQPPISFPEFERWMMEGQRNAAEAH